MTVSRIFLKSPMFIQKRSSLFNLLLKTKKTLTAEESEEKATPKPRRKRVVKAKAVSETGSDESVQAASSEPAAAETETSAETSSSETNAAPEQTEFGTQYQSRPRYDGSQSRRWNNNRYVSNRRYNNRGGNYERNLQSRLEAVQAAQRIENPEEYESKPRLLINDLTKNEYAGTQKSWCTAGNQCR